MKLKTINKILNKKFNDYLTSIEDTRVRDLVQNNTIITGGSIASLLLKEKVNDFDLYFRNRETTVAVAEYYAKQLKGYSARVISEDDRVTIRIKGAGIAEVEPETNDDIPFDDLDIFDETPKEQQEEQEEQKRYRLQYISANAITLSDKIQIVTRFFGEPKEIHSNYDFVHACNYWTSWEGKVKTKKKALQALLARELVYVGSKYPLCSIFRTKKFIERGWRINAGQFLKMAIQLNDLDLKDLQVMEEQLTGIDALYFSQVINDLKEKQVDGDNNAVGTEYYLEIIEKIFD